MSQPSPMTESELAAQLSAAVSESKYEGSTLSESNARNLDAYNQRKTKEFSASPNQSSVVSSDVQDVVEADMPSLARVFMGSGDIVTFGALTNDPDDIQEAEDKTKYVNWLIRGQPWSFKMMHDWLKGGEIQEYTTVKFFMDEQKEVTQEEYQGLSPDEVIAIEESLASQVQQAKVTVESQSEEENEDGTFDVKFKVTTERREVKIINIAPENHILTSNSPTFHGAELEGDRSIVTRGELVARGFSKELVGSLPALNSGSNAQTSNEKQARFAREGGTSEESDFTSWASQKLELLDLYPEIDFDGDGISERRRVLMVGNTVLENDYFEITPYANQTAIQMPHKAIGKSRATITYPTQLQKTAIQRGMNDNIYSVVRPRHAVHPDVIMDDMLTQRPGGIVRTQKGSQVLPSQAVVPLVTPYIGQQALQVLQYIDQSRAQTTGALLANQGLDADTINKETATRFNGVKDASDAKIELIARNYAETGVRKLYDGVAWLVSKFQDTEVEIMVLGKPLKVDPTKWKFNHQLNTNVGLGAGNNEKLIESLQGILAIQDRLKDKGSALTDEADIYNTLRRIVDGLGLPRVDEFFNDPNEPDDLLLAQNEILNNTVTQLEQQIQQMQNPLVEMETIKAQSKAQSDQIKAQADLIKAQSGAQLDIAKLQQEQQQFNRQMLQDNKQFMENMALELTKLEVSSGKNIPGAKV